jgi:hypothetical protein
MARMFIRLAENCLDELSHISMRPDSTSEAVIAAW